jgi:hypothetical protein
MNTGIPNPAERTGAPAPVVEQVGPGLGRQGRAAPVALTRGDVMDTLLGKNNLAAFDAHGGDPYNATGRHFRR